MKRKCHRLSLALCAVLISGMAGAVENDYFPLVAESTYTYKSQFKGKEALNKWVLKPEKREEQEYFYFVNEKDVREPAAIIGVNGIGRGLYFNKDGNVSVVMCLLKSAINATSFKEAVLMLKNPAEVGYKVEGKTHDNQMVRTWTIVGLEDVTVPAGTFKQCLKLEIDEVWPEHKMPNQRQPTGEVKPGEMVPEKKYKDVAWLAKGLGMVKWIRGTGRVDELSEFKIAEVKK